MHVYELAIQRISLTQTMKKRGVFNTCTCTVTNIYDVDVDARQRLPRAGTTGPVYVYNLSCFRRGIYTLSRPLRCCSKRTRCTGSAFCPRICAVELSNENIKCLMTDS